MTEGRIAKDAMLAEFSGEDAILFVAGTRRYHRLNQTAAFIWNALEHDRSDAEIAAALTDAFEVTYDDAIASVRRCIGELQARGLVHEAATPGA